MANAQIKNPSLSPGVSHSHAVRQSLAAHGLGRRPLPFLFLWRMKLFRDLAKRGPSHDKKPKGSCARLWHYTHNKITTCPWKWIVLQAFCLQISWILQDTTILNLGVSPPGGVEILTASNGFSSRSSYGFIFARWPAALAGTGYFFEASPRSCRYSHLLRLYMIK